MNKNIKKIIAIAVIFSAFSASMPATSINLLTTKAYAASNSNKYFDSVGLVDANGDELKLYSGKEYKNNQMVDPEDIEADETYYAKSSTSIVRFDLGGVSSKYVRVFKGSSDSGKGKTLNTDLRLSTDFSSTTMFIIKVYGEDPGDKVKYSEDSTYDLLSTYKVKVEYSGDGNDKLTDSQYSKAYDDIYLDKLSVNGEDIPLVKSQITYTYNVPTSVNEATIKVKPENDDYSVHIAGDFVDKDDKYKKDVDLYKGTNKFEIEIKDEGSSYYRKYTLIINRGTSSTDSQNTNTTQTVDKTNNDNATTIKANQWVQINGKWQYNDATGKPVKRTWMGNYYLQDNGDMATDWLNINGIWYYFGVDGAKKTGWQQVGSNWYYFDSFGMMKTGWILDENTGKYYYLGYDGSMAYNTTVGKYKLGPNGAWIK